jgi:uncharacterized protein
MKKVVIAGGTGFLGKYLAERYAKEGVEVVIIARSSRSDERNIRYVKWDGITLDDWAKELEGAEVLINLAGRTVNCRYTEKNMREIFDSRTGSTKVLGEAIEACTQPPKLWVNSSTATIYRHAEDRPMDELTGELGKGFSVEVAQTWEKAFFSCNTPKTRKVALRVAIVLWGSGGALVPYRNLAKLGLCGKQGNGKQMFSWLHIEDLARIIDYVEEHKELEGVYNASAPNPVNNIDFTAAVRKAYKAPFGLPANKLLLEAGALFMQTETELLLKSRWVLPRKLSDAGFKFKFETLDLALADIVNAGS